MKVRFLSEADVEFRESARYYEDKAPGLGVAFTHRDYDKGAWKP